MIVALRATVIWLIVDVAGYVWERSIRGRDQIVPGRERIVSGRDLGDTLIRRILEAKKDYIQIVLDLRLCDLKFSPGLDPIVLGKGLLPPKDVDQFRLCDFAILVIS